MYVDIYIHMIVHVISTVVFKEMFDGLQYRNPLNPKTLSAEGIWQRSSWKFATLRSSQLKLLARGFWI